MPTSLPPTGPFPKCLIVCCDGTWNTLSQTDRGRRAPTNVVRLALDERRTLFEPAIWAARQPGKDQDAHGDAALRQVWFAGVYSNVSGGYDDTGRADISLGWMMCRAEKRGLRFQQPYRQRLFPNHFGELRDSIDTLIGKTVYKAAPRFLPQPAAGRPCPDSKPLVHYTVFDKHRRGIVTYASPLPLNWCEGQDYELCHDPIQQKIPSEVLS